MRTITTPQARRRQLALTTLSRLDLLFPPASADGSDAAGTAVESPPPALPHPTHEAEPNIGPDDPAEPCPGTSDDGDFDPDGLTRPAEDARGLPAALSSRQILAGYGVPARAADTEAVGETGQDFDHRPPFTVPERDPPARSPADRLTVPAAEPSHRDGATVPEERSTTAGTPMGNRADPRSNPAPSSADPPSVPKPATVSPTTQPRLPLRFRLPTALAFDRRAVLGLTVLLVLAIGYAVQHFWLGRPHPVAVPAISVAESATSPTLEGARTSRLSGPPLVIDVGGKVQHPGLRTLPAGSRVADALAAAGGTLPETDTSLLNLARPLTDGEQILVGTDTPAGGAPAAPTGPVSLNRASAEQLDSLPGVGPALAQRILQYRLTHGPFQSVDDLRHVPGIGARKYEDLKALLTL
ncbi:helix-hairpin-helix domain-containing protein [Kitasatospora sp. NPDC088134]|uniref:helix-hairpin-helix domain-containing protein n=1 Tax=Kitasatospora sp. NPDC088134 TaxID=3364071 RepID=UPI00380FFFD7